MPSLTEVSQLLTRLCSILSGHFPCFDQNSNYSNQIKTI